MTEVKPKIPEEAFALYDQYCHGQIDRRAFFESLGKFAVGGVTVSTLAACMMPDYDKQQTTATSPAFTVETAVYESPGGAGEIAGDLVIPTTLAEPVGGVIVIHENRGLNPHIKDVARRVALSGYVAFAPDALYPLGGYPGTDDEGRVLQRQRDRAEMFADFRNAAEFLRDHPACSGKVACVGFCFGGAVANHMAVEQPWLAGAVPYYGGWPSAEDAARVEVPLQVHLAENDPRINDAWPAYESALKDAGAAYEMFMYPGTQHGFHNDTTPRFNEEAATFAWSRTRAFFDKHLNA